MARPGADRRRQGADFERLATRCEELGIEDVPLVGDRQGAAPRARGPRGVPLPRRAREDPAGQLAVAVLSPAAARRGRTASPSARTATSAAARVTASPLDEIPGIGPARKRALLLHFGTAGKGRAAALEDLQRAPGVERDSRAGGL